MIEGEESVQKRVKEENKFLRTNEGISQRGPRGPERIDCHEKITSPKFDRPEYFDDQETFLLY